MSRCPGSCCFLSKVSGRGVTWWLVVSGAARWWRVLSGGGSIDKFKKHVKIVLPLPRDSELKIFSRCRAVVELKNCLALPRECDMQATDPAIYLRGGEGSGHLYIPAGTSAGGALQAANSGDCVPDAPPPLSASAWATFAWAGDPSLGGCPGQWVAMWTRCGSRNS